jgi:GT2 family glycosyltransferase
MDLSIIIVNYRGWKHLSKCLDSFCTFKGDTFTFEVIIIDNNSSDGRIDDFISDYKDFIFIRNMINGGYANGCNTGSKNSRGDFLLFLNPDTVASEEAVEKLLDRAKTNPGNFISSCSQVNDQNKVVMAFGLFPAFGTLTGTGRLIFKFLKRKKLKEKTRSDYNVIYPDWVSGSVMMLKKEVFLDLGGFDEDFWMYYEDTDLCRRARDLGGEIAYYTDIRIHHFHGGSSRIDLKTTSQTKTEVIISKHLYIAKHIHGAERSLIHLFLILNNLIAGTFMALLGIILFMIPKISGRILIYGKLIGYYSGALKRKSWISPRSVHFIGNN